MVKRLRSLKSYLSPSRRKKKQEEEKPMFTVMPAYPPMGGYPQTPVQYVMLPNQQGSSQSEVEIFQKWDKFLKEQAKEAKEKEKKPDSKKGPELNPTAVFLWMIILSPFVGPLTWWLTAWAFSSGVGMVVEAMKLLPK